MKVQRFLAEVLQPKAIGFYRHQQLLIFSIFMKSLFSKLISTLLISAFVSTILCAQSALPEPWITNRKVDHLTIGDGKVFLTGDFEWFGTHHGDGLAVFNNELTHDNGYPSDYNARLSISDDA